MSVVRLVSLEEVLELPVYPTAGIFPMLLDKAEAPKSTQAMTMTIHDFADQLIEDGGVKEPLVVWNGMLVDGRNRRAAAKLAKIEYVPVRDEEFADEMEADRFIVALNITRRQMSKSQIAAVAALYWPLYEGRQGRPSDDTSTVLGRTSDVLAKMFHVNRTYVDSARSLFINDSDNFKQLHEGRKNLSDVKKSPGQNTRAPNEVSDTDLALDQVNDGYSKIKNAIPVLAKATGESYAAARNNVAAKLAKLQELFDEEFSRGA